ncbi:MAG: LLM class flavin-dependent oxidoreductase [Rhodobacteraceae bacterium]|jgi:probable LLM family oxidoreductase|uniref:Putative oxidoreductase, LLM family n=1 Tax=Salipiger profundus TaxID=1229727 RepID=A0A1U7DC46_9RHOB|nr:MULTISPECIES: Atu2307/SP_0267 family LLM class monooxygenase [Salipiger]APX25709.1 putative oxidoreductase, LLM family [Salipiger profundus]MAB06385.1 LLM class flavin-dependent oxidoreductase [Paracoccaceae bacterium]GGA03909.1 monooxygenase [Salipiger profundus]SFD56245.1 probable oxidoreductase, LLM family [Salipiger profundus]
MELGLYTFGDVGTNPVTGERVDARKRLNDLVEEIRVADEVGLDIFGLGEHHRPNYAVSSPATVLAAASSVTKNIRLSSAVSVLSSDDPVRVFQQFATLDNLSGGRAELMVGRGSFIESFPLFGYDLEDYGDLFEEKLAKLLAINEREKLRWPGTKHTPAVEGLGVYPRPVNDALPIWIAAGGTPQSMVRAGALGTPLALAIIGGEPRRFKPLADLYRRAAEQAGNSDKARVSLNVHGFVGEDGKAAADLFYPAQKAVMDQLGRERGWRPQSRAQYDASCGPEGAMFVGSPAQITDKILGLREDLGFDRVTIQMAIGVIDHAEMLKAIEVLGTQVAPELRKAG